MNEMGMGLSIPKITRPKGKLIAESTALHPADTECGSDKEAQLKQEFTWLCAQKGYVIEGEINVDYQKSVFPERVDSIFCAHVEPAKKGKRATARGPVAAGDFEKRSDRL
jgi:hypothetical protein